MLTCEQLKLVVFSTFCYDLQMLSKKLYELLMFVIFFSVYFTKKIEEKIYPIPSPARAPPK